MNTQSRTPRTDAVAAELFLPLSPQQLRDVSCKLHELSSQLEAEVQDLKERAGILRDTLVYLDNLGGLGLEVHRHISAILARTAPKE